MGAVRSKRGNMVISHGREYDRKIRTNLLEIISVCLRKGDIENAKWFGEQSALLKKRIATYDYRYEDAERALADSLDYRWKQLMSGNV